MLAFSGRHVEQSVWILPLKYNSVLKDLHEQTCWVVCFTAKTAIPSKTVCLKITGSPHENSGHRFGSSLPRRSMLTFCWRLISLFVIQCLAMLSNNEVTEMLLIVMLGANFVLLFFIAWNEWQPASQDAKITVKGSPRLQRGVKQGGMGYLLTEKH